MNLTILRSTGPTTLTKKWYEDGTQSDAGVVTVGIVDAAGNTVVAAGTATTKGGSGSTTTYTYTLAIQTAVKRLTVTWTRTDTGAQLADTIEVVGAVLFTEVEARTFTVSGAQTPLSNSTSYPDATIAEARDRITGLFEQYCGVSFIPRSHHLETAGTGSRTLEIPHHRCIQVLNCTIGGVAQTAAQIIPLHNQRLLHHTTGIFTYPSDADPLNVHVTYEHGWPEPPLDVKRAALLLLLREIVPSDLPDRALSWSNQDGTFRLSTPGDYYPTGLPTVDEVLNRYRYRSLT
jgi:hypothetical protein